MCLNTNFAAQIKIIKKKSILITHYTARARARMRCPSYSSHALPVCTVTVDRNWCIIHVLLHSLVVC